MKSVYVRDELHRQLKVISTEEGVPLIDVLERLITVGLRDYRRQRRAEEKVREKPRLQQSKRIDPQF